MGTNRKDLIQKMLSATGPCLKTVRYSVLFLTAFAAFSSALGDTSLQLGPRRDVSISPKSEGVSEVLITGQTPHFWSHQITVPKSDSVLSFDYFSPSGIKSFSVRFRDKDGTMKFAGSAPMPLVETWQPFSIELTEMPSAETRFHFSMNDRLNSGFQVRNFRLRPPNQKEQTLRRDREKISKDKESAAIALLDYLRDDYPGRIEQIVIGKELVLISGESRNPVRLAELPPEVASNRETPFPTIGIGISGSFTIELPRFADGSKRDRAVSRWRLETETGKIASLAKWPAKIESGATNTSLPKSVAKSIKGIGGVPLIDRDDHPIFELGVHHATVNVVLDALISSRNRRGWKPWNFENRTYYLNENFLSGKDATITRLCSKGIVVTCILLVGNGPGAELKHPDAESRGVFAMPNLTNEKTAHHYRAAIKLLGERYSKPEALIDNWVIHNEVDQAGTWTNMGEQPLALYMENYVRSARMVYHTTRLHNPHSRVFISLTHHWAKKSGGVGTYQVREMIDLWSEMAKAEGEFDWGVAYHPYPQDLRNPDTWDDKEVTFDFDTPYITPKNIEVLPAYLGPERPILLSEQGFNTPTLSEVDQKRQAAGLIYMFRKLGELPSIEAYHLHRYQDMPDAEGGLRLGIMDENGNRKLGWDTYTAIGTDAEAKYAAAADEILPDPIPVREIKK